MCYPAEFGRSNSNGTSVIKEIRLKNDYTRPAYQGHPRSSEPTRIDPHLWLPIKVPLPQLLTYLITLRDKRRFQLKIAYFSHPMYFAPPDEGFAIGIGYRRTGWKTRMMALQGRQRSLTISSVVWIQYTNVSDGQTDGHRADSKTALTHSVAG